MTNASKQSDWVALDVDGVILDFETQFHHIAESTLGRRLEVVAETFDLGDRYALARRELDACWQAMHASGWRNMPCVEGIESVIGLLRDGGFRIAAVTGIPPQFGGQRCLNLASNGIPVDQVVCTGHAHVSKQIALTPFDPVLYVDDLPGHCHDAAALGVPHTLHVVNSYSEPAQDPVVRCDNLHAVYDYIHRLIHPGKGARDRA